MSKEKSCRKCPKPVEQKLKIFPEGFKEKERRKKKLERVYVIETSSYSQTKKVGLKKSNFVV